MTQPEPFRTGQANPRWRRPRSAISALLAAGACLPGTPATVVAAEPANSAGADVALILSVDVSDSVDEARYYLQMDGIAKALEDPVIITAITSGAKGRILLAMAVWADRTEIAVPWTIIASKDDALTLAGKIRHLKRYSGEFTCLARMFSSLGNTLINDLPLAPERLVIDVSGDGVDNCSPDENTKAERDALVKRGVTINGLPIIEHLGEIVGAGAYRAPGDPMGNLRPLEKVQLTLDAWYREHVMGGPFSFILPAQGYSDFDRAMRQKFVTEISALPASPRRQEPASLALHRNSKTAAMEIARIP